MRLRIPSLARGPCPHPTHPNTRPIVTIGSPLRVAVGTSVREDGRPSKSLVLRPGSLLLFWGDSYTDHLHGIAADSACQTVGDWVANGEASAAELGTTVQRGQRTSLTIRRVNNAVSERETERELDETS